MQRIITLIVISFILTQSLFSQEQTVGLFINNSPSFNGYTLFNPMRSNTTYLIDNCGRKINTWISNYKPKMSVYFLESGHLLKTCKTDELSGYSARLEKYNWNGDLVWSYNFNGDNFDPHHDVEPLPNGNILIISHDIRTPAEAILAGRIPDNIGNEFWSEKIVEIQPIGIDEAIIVWEWYVWDHLIQDYDITKNNYGVINEHPELFNINYSVKLGPNTFVDWIHLNGIDYNSELDQIIISSRNISELYIIDHSTTTAEAADHSGGIYGKGGDIQYRFGNPVAYDRGTIEDRKSFFQHDARWINSIDPDDGKILFFNNQAGTDSSTVCVFNPPIDSPGFYTNPGSDAFGPDEFDWVYGSTEIFSSNISGVQRLPNGNTLICAGTSGKFREVNVDGHVVWEYINPDGLNGPVDQGVPPTLNNVFKINRYAPEYSGFEGLELIPGDLIELNPWPSDCEISTDTSAFINLNVFLEGPFNGMEMNNELYSSDLVEYNQPFNTEPWNYQGTEILSESLNDQVVNWLLIELRDSENAPLADPSKIMDRQAVLLLKNGTVVNYKGESDLKFYNSITNSLFVVIYQANHLPIISSNPLYNEITTLKYDFTSAEGQVLGGSLSHSEIGGGIWGMAAGNGFPDLQVDDLDKFNVWIIQSGMSGPFQGDFNLDTQVNNIDKIDFWIKNLGMESQVPQ